MGFHKVLVATAMFTSFCAGARADATQITGHTRASIKVASQIQQTIGEALSPTCPRVDTINVNADFDVAKFPKLPGSLPPVKGPVQYELWVVAGCGRITHFAVELWHDQYGEHFAAAASVGS
jgi:hypothetical protein